MMDPLRFVHPVMTAKEQAAIAAIRGTPQELPSAPFSRALALWLCRTCSMWDAPDRERCKGEHCGVVRT